MVAGLEQLTGGDVLIDGRNVNAVPSNERDVAMAFQDHALYPHMTVAENIGFPMWVDHVHQSIVERRIQETASALQLTDVLHLQAGAAVRAVNVNGRRWVGRSCATHGCS